MALFQGSQPPGSNAGRHYKARETLYEGGNAPEMLARAAALVASGVNETPLSASRR